MTPGMSSFPATCVLKGRRGVRATPASLQDANCFRARLPTVEPLGFVPACEVELNACGLADTEQLAGVGNFTGDCSGGHHHGTHQERPTGGAALPTFEIAVR